MSLIGDIIQQEIAAGLTDWLCKKFGWKKSSTSHIVSERAPSRRAHRRKRKKS
nr:hypothetical protein [Novosphingobium panipatense]